MEPEAYEELYRLEGDHWWYQGMRHITERLLGDVLSGQEGLRILDAGCGVGGNMAALSRYGQVYGFDYSPLALGYAKDSQAGRLALATVEALPFPDDTFDLVTSFDVIYCYEVKDDRKAISEFGRVTRPGGSVLVRVPALPALRGPHDAFVHGARRYTAPELHRKFEQAGLSPVRVTYANSVLMPAIFVTRKLQSLAVRLGAKPASDVNPTPAALNRVLTWVLDLEACWIGRKRNLPFGVSLFILARKPLSA